MVKISVIIATFNRCEALQENLHALVRQTLSNDSFEIIVVDNNSSDNTKAKVLSIIDLYSGNKIQYIHEYKQGVSYARNAGIKVASGEFLAFINDDAQADQNWLNLILQTFNKLDENVFALGGKLLPSFKEKLPGWFKEEYEIFDWGENERYFFNHEFPYGSNLIVRKSAFETYGYFDPDFGMIKSKIIPGEEKEFINRVRINNKDAKVYYHPSIIVYHNVRSYKLSLKYKLLRAFYSGYATQKISKKLKTGNLDISFVKQNQWSNLLKLFKIKSYFHWKQYLYENFKRFFYLSGKIMAKIY